ncbi:PLP-dependent aminotransferase family protein [Leadbetterella byssophila]|uniref:aminotransferase-like domain-containing protein n=1 Tax=Leadbetterella byssophila TaxID=316068 RepID=UPI00399F1718
MEAVMETDFLYRQVADPIEQQILTGILPTGTKLWSLRTLSREYGISQNTALNVYYYLEAKNLIESRPQSGYYVKYSPIKKVQQASLPSPRAVLADDSYWVHSVYQNIGQDHPLAMAHPGEALLPIAKLNKALIQASRSLQGSGVLYEKPEGNAELRKQVARWSIPLREDEIITTHGCLNAISLCLLSLTQPGDTIIVESPVSFGMLQVAKSLSLKVIELPTHPEYGISLLALERNLKKRRIAACLFIPTFSNPLGFCMSDEDKWKLVQLCEKYQVPLIENDINADVHFGKKRPKSCKSFDKSGIVLWCGSVSKTLAPGYRVGWVAPGRFYHEVLKTKIQHQISSTSITQEVIAHYLRTGRYEHHLRKLRVSLQAQLLHFQKAIADYFPRSTKVTSPQGGFTIWVQLHKDLNTLEIFEQCKKYDVSFAPGALFSLQHLYSNCLRLNFSLGWNSEVEEKLERLGEILKKT